MSTGSPKRALVLALAALTSACATLPSPPPVLHTFTGHYTGSEDGSWFRPCGAAEGRMWVTVVEGAVAQADALRGEGLMGAEPTFVRWRAERITDGRVGPGGPALLVRDILEARPPAADDCPAG